MKIFVFNVQSKHTFNTHIIPFIFQLQAHLEVTHKRNLSK